MKVTEIYPFYLQNSRQNQHSNMNTYQRSKQYGGSLPTPMGRCIQRHRFIPLVKIHLFGRSRQHAKMAQGSQWFYKGITDWVKISMLAKWSQSATRSDEWRHHKAYVSNKITNWSIDSGIPAATQGSRCCASGTLCFAMWTPKLLN